MASSSYQLLMDYALKLLSVRPHSEFELQQKINKKFAPEPELLGTIISRLKELKYLNDEEFTAMFIRSYSGKRSRGIYSLQNQLKKKGIAKDLVEKTLNDLDFDEADACQIAAERKLKTLKPDLSSQKRLQKLQSFLVGRGFSYDKIYEVLAKIKGNW